MALISVFIDQIRTDRVGRYEELIRELAAEARKKKEGWRWTANEVGFGRRSTMHYVSRHEDYADLEKHGDPQALFTRVLGTKKGEKHLEELNESLISSERLLGLHRPDLSYPKEPAEGIVPVTSVAMLHARPGFQQTVEELLLKLAEAIPKTGESARVASFQAVTGDMLVYWIVRPLNRLADLDQQSIGRDLLINAYGQNEGAQHFRSGLEGVDQLRREIVFYREDLSNPPG
jgi:hypothetical protein